MKPFIGITMGDPAGIGPEVTLKALARPEIFDLCRPIIIGSNEVIKDVIKLCGLELTVNIVKDNFEFEYRDKSVNILDLGNIDLNFLELGRVSEKCGRAAYQYVERAVSLAMDGRIKAVATAPVNKEALKLAGVPYIGHTEMLQGLTGVEDPLTMFQVDTLRIFFLSRHVSLRKACDFVSSDKVFETVVRSHKALLRLGVEDPVIAVAALNPHGGEHGMFGEEETEHIEPGINKARRAGYKVEGPVPADSVFYLALQGKYDGVISLYHDQGHIAAKMHDFEKTVSITNGLPFLRTSVDHGTAYDIAGRGMASGTSMYEAIRLAADYSRYY